MKIVLFYHSVISDWNHGNAHFLRGIATELLRRGHNVIILEPADGWSLSNLVAERGVQVFRDFEGSFPQLIPFFYNPDRPELDHHLLGADLVIVHEWNEHPVVELLGIKKKKFGYRLFFHDTHHRAVSDPAAMMRYDLSCYDGVLAYGDVIRDMYLRKGWARKAWTWHEAADGAVFYPRPAREKEGDLVWVGNWGDDERAEMLDEFLIKPVRDLGLSASVYGVRYPQEAILKLEEAGIRYKGYLPSVEVPHVFSRYRFTVHVPRRPYVSELPGIPTIRPFEAMACGIPLLSAPWGKADTVFTPGEDFLMARDGEEMKKYMHQLLRFEAMGERLRKSAYSTIRSRHLCAHRVDQLFSILNRPEKESCPVTYLNSSYT
ncbi:MAG: glycosyltransferase [Cytophagaceae bacterium SCN 52-12]|nr:MAG: glycosyltransferase [Cytophagaceae bacterium SCN 52-12]